MHEGTAGPVRTCSDETWEMIPWYVNGTLPNDQVAAFEADARSCPACQAEIARLEALAEEVSHGEQFEEAKARSWATLNAQIEAEKAARAPKPRGWFSGVNTGALGFGGAALAACLVLAFQFSGPSEDGFVTLTSGGDETVIMLQPADGLEREVLEALLAEQGLTIAAGPTDAGLYTVTLPTDADPEALAGILAALPEVDFAAPSGP